MKFDIHYLITAKYAKWVVLGLITLFSLLIVYEFASLFFTGTAKNNSSIVNNDPQVSVKQDSFHDILSSSVFGIYVPNDLNESSVKESMLNVTLVGIMYADNLDDSQVIIRSASGEEKSYKIGDSIPGGAVIKRIMANGVLVERQGAIESLSLPKIDLNFEPIAKPLTEE